MLSHDEAQFVEATECTLHHHNLEQIDHPLHCQSIAIPHENTDLGIVTVSAGVAYLQPSNKQNALELVRQADAALYRAKSAGRDSYVIADDLF